jgi:hypothetical protein
MKIKVVALFSTMIVAVALFFPIGHSRAQEISLPEPRTVGSYTIDHMIQMADGKGNYLSIKFDGNYNGPRNLDRVICYTWERKRGGPSGEFEEAASAVV